MASDAQKQPRLSLSRFFFFLISLRPILNNDATLFSQFWWIAVVMGLQRHNLQGAQEEVLGITCEVLHLSRGRMAKHQHAPLEPWSESATDGSRRLVWLGLQLAKRPAWCWRLLQTLRLRPLLCFSVFQPSRCDCYDFNDLLRCVEVMQHQQLWFPCCISVWTHFEFQPNNPELVLHRKWRNDV